MFSDISNRLSVLTQDVKVLILGSLNHNLHEVLQKNFNHIDNLDFTEDTLALLDRNFFSQFQLIIFSFSKSNLEFYSSKCGFLPENSISLLKEEVYTDFMPFINQSYGILLEPISSDSFINKITINLIINESIIAAKIKEDALEKFEKSKVNADLDLFLDQYSGNVMFINEELSFNQKKLKDLEISKKLFDEISSNLLMLTEIFKENNNLKHLASLLLELSDFLSNLEFESIDPSRLSTFDYLTKIIDDLIKCTDELFIDRLFEDVKVFEDSMQSNIRYFKEELLNDNAKSDNLEFF